MASTLGSSSRGRALAERLNLAFQRARNAPAPGVTALPILHGLTPKASSLAPLENIRAQAAEILVQSGRCFRFHGDVVIEVDDGEDKSLVNLTTGGDVGRGAESLLANVFNCDVPRGEDGFEYFSPPSRFVADLLTSSAAMSVLPRINTYARRPIHGDDFELIGPGWNQERGVLIHGPDIDPVQLADCDLLAPFLERLPPRLRELISIFPFKEDADAANYIAALLTGILADRFVSTGKPILLLDGNRPQVGKTLLARIIGILLDGENPTLIPFKTDEAELIKEACASLRPGRSSVLVFDNAKLGRGAELSSPFIEANSLAPKVTARILGQSQLLMRDNDLIWVITMNNIRAGKDIVARQLPVRLHCEGDPSQRPHVEPGPLEIAVEYRSEILAELFGMVVRWNQQGRPRAVPQHTCREWCRLIGGIMQANGLPEFLANAEDATSEFDSSTDGLAAIAEYVIRQGDEAYFHAASQVGETMQSSTNVTLDTGKPAKEWISVLNASNVLEGDLQLSRSDQSKSVVVGNYLKANLDRKVPMAVGGRRGKAVLRKRDGSSNRTLYYFEVSWIDDETEAGDPPSCPRERLRRSSRHAS